jgi:hypothetical protein
MRNLLVILVLAADAAFISLVCEPSWDRAAAALTAVVAVGQAQLPRAARG